MATTPNGLWYPGLGDAPNGPGNMQQLAQSVDDRYAGKVANSAGLPGILSPFKGMRVFIENSQETAVFDGTDWTNYWRSFTTTWTGSTTNPTAGSHTILSRYRSVDKWVDFQIRITFGSANYGSGTYFLTLPRDPRSPVAGDVINGSAIIYDTSANARRAGALAWSTTAVGIFVIDSSTGTAVSNSAPFTLASGDVLSIAGGYEKPAA